MSKWIILSNRLLLGTKMEGMCRIFGKILATYIFFETVHLKIVARFDFVTILEWVLKSL